ncbi:MarR family winged helix-turn-helix transcriptional regulator [Amycolatopsis magusensis]|uniref:DNA-binding MarR family transcriptional regulator n=1 Tax=Amycolatopsis magusensis TaxID=882444 RepID=A0ABS4PJ69_9PSEU|nr:MarR family transcriptional regulator [Amycolatopsis magusensis]MBP2179467.1 DNA-binding MarR family transcriptional regulator [Amycolatopsis magusensis]MDI5978539.1 MarR family transcriptional regulator [Amycolatopsis magusensis]
MSEEEPRWLSEREMLAWRSYIVATLHLRQRLHRELAEEHDLSLIDYEVLVALSASDDGRVRMSELAAMLGSTKSRLSHQVGRLEHEGYVQRERDPADRRGVITVLTEHGRSLLQRAAPTHVTGVRAHLIDLLTEEEQIVLGEAFTRVNNHLGGGW